MRSVPRFCIRAAEPKAFGPLDEGRYAHIPGMFSVTEEQAAAIRQAYEQSGELAAMVELRRHFRGITDNENARRCVRIIVGWHTPPQSDPETSDQDGEATGGKA